jgi:putative Mn2+ efflux pump MntP
VYERNPGDTWAFTVLFDRLPLGLMVALVYFGIFRASALLGVIAFVLLGAGFLISSPNRWGVGIALHYVSRVVWPDPVDPLPPTADPEEDALR